jgi:hypothetical protein
MAPTPQTTIRVGPERKRKWAACAESCGYTVSELIRVYMDGAVDGTIAIPDHPKDGRCRFGEAAACSQQVTVYPWATICQTCGNRDRCPA